MWLFIIFQNKSILRIRQTNDYSSIFNADTSLLTVSRVTWDISRVNECKTAKIVYSGMPSIDLYL